MKFETRNLSCLRQIRRGGKFGVIAVALLLLTGCEEPTLPPGGFGAQALLSTDTLLIGDAVTLTLTARHPTGSAVTFPIVGKGKEVVLRGRSAHTHELTKGILETEEIIQLTSYRTGNWSVHAEPAVCTFENGTEKAQALPPLILHIKSSLEDINTDELADIKDPVKPPWRMAQVLWVIGGIILIALLAGGLTRWFMRRPKALLSAEPVIPPHVAARNALSALRNTEWIPEPFFVQISLILRTYLEDRFDLNAPESTTEELAAKLNCDPSLTPQDQNTLRNFFTQADLVKFARAGAEQEVMRTAFTTVETFVDQTTV